MAKEDKDVAGEGAGHHTRGRVCSPEGSARVSRENLGLLVTARRSLALPGRIGPLLIMRGPSSIVPTAWRLLLFRERR